MKTFSLILLCTLLTFFCYFFVIFFDKVSNSRNSILRSQKRKVVVSNYQQELQVPNHLKVLPTFICVFQLPLLWNAKFLSFLLSYQKNPFFQHVKYYLSRVSTSRNIILKSCNSVFHPSWQIFVIFFPIKLIALWRYSYEVPKTIFILYWVHM